MTAARLMLYATDWNNAKNKKACQIVLKAENPHESDSFVMNAQACPQQTYAHPHRAMPARSQRPGGVKSILWTACCCQKDRDIKLNVKGRYGSWTLISYLNFVYIFYLNVQFPFCRP